MSNQEQQEEEREVLLSIYDGDENFFDITPTQYQYKIGNDGESQSAMMEITWGENYPEELPTVNMDVFYNKHLAFDVKDLMKEKLLAEAEVLLGCGSTYTLFEYAKENKDSLLELQSSQPVKVPEQISELSSQPAAEEDSLKPIKQRKEQLTKNQKRRMYDRFGTQGMMEGKQRGWDWVCGVRHLSQTGVKADGQ